VNGGLQEAQDQTADQRGALEASSAVQGRLLISHSICIVATAPKAQ